MADFVLEGPKWGSTGIGTAGGIVTWAIDATIPASFLTALSSAFADWAHYANIQFQEVASTVSSQIDFSLGAIDGLNNVLGQDELFTPGPSSPPHLSNLTAAKDGMWREARSSAMAV